MKKTVERILSVVLCMALVLGSSADVLAVEQVQTPDQSVAADEVVSPDDSATQPDEEMPGGELEETEEEPQEPQIPQDEVEEPKAPETQPEETESADTQETKKNISLRGFSWIDHKNALDVGAAYDTTETDVMFRWIGYNISTQEWFLISDWKSGNWITFVPPAAGGYLIQVQVKTSTDAEALAVDTMGYTVSAPTVEIKGICLQENSASVNAGAAYVSNDPQVEFQCMIYSLKTNKWSVVGSWQKGNWFTWAATEPGDYWIHIQAKTRWDKEPSASYTIGYRVQSASIQSFTTDKKSPQWQNTSVVLKGSVNNKANQKITEQYLVYNGTEWRQLENNGSSAVWTPEQLGSYLLCYQILDADGNCLEQKFMGYAIEEPRISMRGIYVRKDPGNVYSMAVAVDTNDAYAQYKWQYYDLAKKEWGVIADWGNNQSVSWTAPASGNYWLYVQGKTYGDKMADYCISYSVNNYFSDRIGFFSTVSTNDRFGTFNMKLALTFFNGIVINPGETLSFNQTTGYCGPQQGFVQAGVVGGVGYGGGICQTATTLYGAFMRAGLTIVQRKNHSIMSTYVPIGLDAMIDYGSSDLVVRNDLGFPVKILTSADGNILYVQIYGNRTWWYDSIEPYSWQTGSRTASAVRNYYRNGQIVHTQPLPDSVY